MKKIIIVIFAIQLAINVWAKEYYTVQVKALPISKFGEILSLYNALKNKGYLVYYYECMLKEKEWVRLRVGCFTDIKQAEEYGKKIKKKERLEYFVDIADIYVDNYNSKFSVITTPNAIWVKRDDDNKEIFKSSDTSIGISKALISPSGKDIVFYYNEKIYKIDIENKITNILKEGVYYADPKWSYKGDYIAYFDEYEWEVPTSLWVMTADGKENKCLVENSKTEKRVKHFEWHPSKNEIFFVEGYAYGTVSVGGNLYSIDFNGNRKTIIMANSQNKEEIYEYFSIENNFILYKIVHFDKIPKTNNSQSIR